MIPNKITFSRYKIILLEVLHEFDEDQEEHFNFVMTGMKRVDGIDVSDRLWKYTFKPNYDSEYSVLMDVRYMHEWFENLVNSLGILLPKKADSFSGSFIFNVSIYVQDLPLSIKTLCIVNTMDNGLEASMIKTLIAINSRQEELDLIIRDLSSEETTTETDWEKVSEKAISIFNKRHNKSN